MHQLKYVTHGNLGLLFIKNREIGISKNQNLQIVLKGAYLPNLTDFRTGCIICRIPTLSENFGSFHEIISLTRPVVLTISPGQFCTVGGVASVIEIQV